MDKNQIKQVAINEHCIVIDCTDTPRMIEHIYQLDNHIDENGKVLVKDLSTLSCVPSAIINAETFNDYLFLLDDGSIVAASYFRTQSRLEFNMREKVYETIYTAILFSIGRDKFINLKDVYVSAEQIGCVKTMPNLDVIDNIGINNNDILVFCGNGYPTYTDVRLMKIDEMMILQQHVYHTLNHISKNNQK